MLHKQGLCHNARVDIEGWGGVEEEAVSVGRAAKYTKLLPCVAGASSAEIHAEGMLPRRPAHALIAADDVRWHVTWLGRRHTTRRIYALDTRRKRLQGGVLHTPSLQSDH